ncbi:MAG: peptidylprolyl isomerase [Phenylobacterium sp.]|uniref:peptidylprolyl isomerase n=1 Tax=Phenylobacterium sp. TaxID=1871053 RepID=UPI00271AA596|nr:peptidylprolyl isomerase [Phenylobacterium sp.]MDO9430297.1 peptidylprolyl isomerase [Phenylobacterium sp.]
MIRALALAVALLAPAAHAGEWRALDPAQTLVIDTTKGRIVVEMRPDFAPLAVERVKLLAREGVYDGLLFHRVVDHFVDQTGNPDNKDGGVSRHPDLAPEFTFRMKQPGHAAVVARSSDAISGFVGATPFAAASDIELQRNPQAGRLAWGAYCPGVAGMGRQAAETTANSEIFFMREASRRLDRDYTVWGAVVQGLDVVRAMTVGEPPAHPDRMIKVRLAADLPPVERPRIEILDEHSAAFGALVKEVRAAKGADFTVCDIQVPTRSVP